jgi:hypothetical protein
MSVAFTAPAACAWLHQKSVFYWLMQALNDITAGIIEEAIYIHRHLGPGLLESVYEAILYDRLSKAGFVVDRQVEVPVIFNGIN